MSVIPPLPPPGEDDNFFTFLKNVPKNVPPPSQPKQKIVLPQASSWRWMTVTIMVVAAICAVIYVASPTLEAIAPDPALREVRSLLEKNLPTGQWEEIQWWPLRLCPAPNEDRSYDTWQGHRICRLKFRALNEQGVMEVMDQVFVIEDSQIRTIRPFNKKDTAREWRERFPSDPY